MLYLSLLWGLCRHADATSEKQDHWTGTHFWNIPLDRFHCIGMAPKAPEGPARCVGLMKKWRQGGLARRGWWCGSRGGSKCRSRKQGGTILEHRTFDFGFIMGQVELMKINRWLNPTRFSEWAIQLCRYSTKVLTWNHERLYETREAVYFSMSGQCDNGYTVESA